MTSGCRTPKRCVRTAWPWRSRPPPPPAAPCGWTATRRRAAMSERTDRVVVVPGPGRVALVEEPAAELRDGMFRVATLYTGVSAGTELSYVKGTNPALDARWDPALGLFRPGTPVDPYPVKRLGYMEVARVVE